MSNDQIRDQTNDQCLMLIERTRAVVRAAWLLCDNTEVGESGLPIVDLDDWEGLANALKSLEGLIPSKDQPASAGHAVTVLSERLQSLRTERDTLKAAHKANIETISQVQSRAESAEAKLREWEDNANSIINDAAVPIRAREGGGPEDLIMSLVLTIGRMKMDLKRITDTVRGVLSHRVGEVPAKGWLRDNDASRKAIAELADLVGYEPFDPQRSNRTEMYDGID